MRLKVPFYGFALAVIGFFVPLIVFAAFLPSLINAEPVKKRFMEELKSWTGAEVDLAGPVAIESFFSLSLKAENVVFRAFGKTPSLRDVEADQIVARISWIDLLSGNLDFDKIKIDKAIFNLSATRKEEIAGSLRSLLAASYRTPFAVLVVTNSKIVIAGDADAEGSEAGISNLVINVKGSDGDISLNGQVTWRRENVELTITSKASGAVKDSLSTPLKLDLASKHVTGRFEGELFTGKEGSVKGHIEVSTPNPAVLSEWLGRGMRFDLADPVRMNATLNVSGKTINMQSGIFSVAGEEASGDLNIAFNGEARLEGSLAFDSLDIAKFWSGSSDASHERSGRAPIARFLGTQDLDLRISANKASWGALPLGTAAFTLSGRGGKLISEIAQLDIFDGLVFGHVEADFGDELPKIKGRVTADAADAAKLGALAFRDAGLTGRMDANIELQAEGWTETQLIRSLKAVMRADFPEGGQMKLDLLQVAQSASAEGQDGWNHNALSWWAFDDLRFKLSIEKDRLRFEDLVLRSGSGQVRGKGKIDLQQRDLDWQLSVDSSQKKSALGTDSKEDRGPRADLFIQGPWSRPSIRLLPRYSRAGANIFFAPDVDIAQDRF